MPEAVLEHNHACKHPSIPGTSTDDKAYEVFVSKTRSAFTDFVESDPILLFVDSTGLFDVFLANVREETRAANTCNTCRQFFDRYGGIVQVDDITGAKFSPIWLDEFAPIDLRDAVAAVCAEVARRPIKGVFVPEKAQLGAATSGGFSHIAVNVPSKLVWRNKKNTAGQWEAKLKEDHKDLCRALSELSVPMLQDALRLLNANALSRAHSVVQRVEWILALKTLKVKGRPYDNLIWRAVANAPAGWCQIRSSVLSTLFDDLMSGKPFADVSRNWTAKLDPLQYQRPQAAPTTGAVAAAEKIFEKMGLSSASQRRFARLSDLKTSWTPKPAPEQKAEGLFGHLATKDSKKDSYVPVQAPPTALTWVKFAAKYLASACKMEMLVRQYDSYTAFVTAVHADAQPILQWDHPDCRNPVSWYCYRDQQNNASYVWNLTAGSWADVTAVSSRPSEWNSAERTTVVLVLAGARDSGARSRAGLALFPEILRSELHEVRSVIEAFSNAGTLEGAEDSDACGIVLAENSPPRSEVPIRLRVTDNNGLVTEFNIGSFD